MCSWSTCDPDCTPLDEEVARRLRYAGQARDLRGQQGRPRRFDLQADEFYRLGPTRSFASAPCKTATRATCWTRSSSAAAGWPRSQAHRRTDHEAGDRRPPQRRQEHVHQHAGPKHDRMIVSEVPGTTRDSVDVRFEMDGKTFIAIDTPGVRERKSIRKDIDFYGTASGAAEHPPSGCGPAVLRCRPADQQGRQAAVRLHRARTTSPAFSWSTSGI